MDQVKELQKRGFYLAGQSSCSTYLQDNLAFPFFNVFPDYDVCKLCETTTTLKMETSFILYVHVIYGLEFDVWEDKLRDSFVFRSINEINLHIRRIATNRVINEMDIFLTYPRKEYLKIYIHMDILVTVLDNSGFLF